MMMLSIFHYLRIVKTRLHHNDPAISASNTNVSRSVNKVIKYMKDKHILPPVLLRHTISKEKLLYPYGGTYFSLNTRFDYTFGLHIPNMIPLYLGLFRK